jgi:hypothetical protein
MVEVVEEAKRQKRQIVVLTETHFDVADSIRFGEIAEKNGYACFSVTRVMKRFDSGSGGDQWTWVRERKKQGGAHKRT